MSRLRARRPGRLVAAGRGLAVPVAALLLASCLAERAPPAPGPGERARAALRPPAIAADVGFLADDVLGGRATPSLGQRIAARYLRDRLQRLGFEPGARSGWFQEYPLERLRLDGERATMSLVGPAGERSLEYGVDFGLHWAELVDGSWRGKLVWCGGGTRAELGDVELDGRWAVCVAGAQARNSRRHFVERAGAGGLIVIARSAEDAPLTTWAERLHEGKSRWPRDPEPDRIPAVWLSAAAGEALLADAPAVGAEFALQAVLHVAATEPLVAENVCAFLRGSDPELAREAIAVSAHYDHLGVVDGEIYNGADDNASGSAGLLALADALHARGPLPRSVLLLWVSGEERMFLGSRAWVEERFVPHGAAVICDVNLDMIGRNAPELLEYTPTPSHDAFNRVSSLALGFMPAEGFTELSSADRDFARSDHFMFSKELDVPVLYLSGGEHDDYHEPTDTADKIDAVKIARVVRVVLDLLEALQEPGLDLWDTAAAGGETGEPAGG